MQAATSFLRLFIDEESLALPDVFEGRVVKRAVKAVVILLFERPFWNHFRCLQHTRRSYS